MKEFAQLPSAFFAPKDKREVMVDEMNVGTKDPLADGVAKGSA